MRVDPGDHHQLRRVYFIYTSYLLGTYFTFINIGYFQSASRFVFTFYVVKHAHAFGGSLLIK